MSRSRAGVSNDPYRPLSGSLVGAAVQHIKEEDETYNVSEEEEEEEKITFRQTEIETIEKVLAVIDRSAAKRINEGFSDFNFTVGVLNCLLVSVTFCRYPQHFWLLYLIESLYLIPKGFWFNLRAKPLNQVLYYLDYCWVMNILGNVLLLSVTSLASFSRETRRQILMTTVGTSTGVLTGACLMLPFVAIVFHDLRTMTGVLIHLLPTMMTYTFLWHRTEISAAWPQIFPYNYEYSEMPFFPNNKAALIIPGTGLGSIAGNAIALYSFWWVLYAVWMVFLGGLNLPRKDRAHPPKYDTVFHSTIRNGLAVVIGSVCWRRPVRVSLQEQETDHYEVRDFFVYMLGHAICAYFGGTMLLANLCWHSRRAHLAIISLLTVVAVYRGAERYTYYATEMYGRSVRKEFKDILPEEPPKRRKGKKQ
jgi:hypothetical protein